MAPSSLELRLISCRDVKAFNLFKKLCIYATVSIINQPPNNKKKRTERYQQQKTQVDKEGDGYAVWKHQMTFDLREISCLDLENLFLDFDLKCEGIVYGNNTVGQVRVPIKELVRQDCKGSVSYQVMSTDGRHNGVLDFSYKVIDVDENGDDKVPENRYIPTVIDQIPENRYQQTLLQENRSQPTPSIYPSLESIEMNYVPPVMPEIHQQQEILPESIYPKYTFPVLPEKPHVYFPPPAEVKNYYSPLPYVYSPVATPYWSNGTAFPGYNYNASDAYPSNHLYQTYSNFARY